MGFVVRGNGRKLCYNSQWRGNIGYWSSEVTGKRESGKRCEVQAWEEQAGWHAGSWQGEGGGGFGMSACVGCRMQGRRGNERNVAMQDEAKCGCVYVGERSDGRGFVGLRSVL